MSSIGSYEWSMKNKGLLKKIEKFTIFRMIFESEMKLVIDKLIFPKTRMGRIDYDKISIPDSAVVLSVIEDTSSIYSVALLNHCIRTFYWGNLLSQIDGIRLDQELFFLSCYLHDLGITERHLDGAKCSCFAVNGAIQAERILKERNFENAKIKIIFESISAHLNPIVKMEDFGAEAVYLNQGAFLDVTGKRLHRIPGNVRDNVLRSYPFNNFMSEIRQTMVAGHHASSRAGIMKRGFIQMLNNNPLKDVRIN